MPAIAAGMLDDWLGGSAVSYTHLDVYKRQEENSSALLILLLTTHLLYCPLKISSRL